MRGAGVIWAGPGRTRRPRVHRRSWPARAIQISRGFDSQPTRGSDFLGLGMWHGNARDPPWSPDPPRSSPGPPHRRARRCWPVTQGPRAPGRVRPGPEARRTAPTRKSRTHESHDRCPPLRGRGCPRCRSHHPGPPGPLHRRSAWAGRTRRRQPRGMGPHRLRGGRGHRRARADLTGGTGCLSPSPRFRCGPGRA